MKSLQRGTFAHFALPNVTVRISRMSSVPWKTERRLAVFGVSSASHPSVRMTVRTLGFLERSPMVENRSLSDFQTLRKSVQTEFEYRLVIPERSVTNASTSRVLGMASLDSPENTVSEYAFSGCLRTVPTTKVFALSNRLVSSHSSMASIDRDTSSTNTTSFCGEAAVFKSTVTGENAMASQARASAKSALLSIRSLGRTR